MPLPYDPRFPPVGFDRTMEAYGHPQAIPPAAATVPGVARKGAAMPGRPAGITHVRNDQQYASLIDQPVSLSTTSIKVLDSPVGLRNLLIMRNVDAAATIYVSWGKDANVNSTVALAPGQMLLFDSVVPQDDIYAVGSAATPILAIAYSTIPAE